MTEVRHVLDDVKQRIENTEFVRGDLQGREGGERSISETLEISHF